VQDGQKTILTHPSPTAAIQGHWIWDTKEGAAEQGVTCLFRRSFSLDQVPRNSVLHVSADGRYRAWLNGRLISRGPCRGTPEFYHYETVELAPYLHDGTNVLAAEVRWYGRRFEPRAEVHLTPGLWAMIESSDGTAALVTDAAWRVLRSPGHVLHPIPTNHPVTGWYCVVDPTEDLDLRRIPAGWNNAGFDDSAWPHAVQVGPAIGRYQPRTWYFSGHELVPREIPPMEESPFLPAGFHGFGKINLTQDPEKSRQIEGALVPVRRYANPLWGDFARSLPLEGAGAHYVIINMGKLFTGYPRLILTAPAGTLVELRYAEALTRNFKKGIRDDLAGAVEGYHDLFVCREGENTVEPFVWRTFRFLRIAVHHPAGPAHIDRLDTVFTAYPFRELAAFDSSDPLHGRIWQTSWWTARLCAHEHYEDCPYYEQVQYVYDARLQSLAGYLVTGDFRLARQALRQFARSRRSDGITLSRAPAVAWEPVIIPDLSLVWIEYLEDFYRYSGDLTLVHELWDCVESTLKWFEQFDHEGLLDDVPYWCFSDWSLPSGGRHICGSTGQLNMKRIGALRAAARLARAAGKADRAAAFVARADVAVRAVKARLWNPSAGLFNDEPDGTLVAEHASLQAILYDVVDVKSAYEIIPRLEMRNDLARTTIAYAYYTFRVYEKLGLYDNVWASRLHNWTDQLNLQATTWFEKNEPSRSDCHGWGSWIMTEFLTAILGLTPAEPGFAVVRIVPHVLDLAWARGRMPTVRGDILAEWKRDGDLIHYEVKLPSGVTGTLVTPGGEQHPLTHGRQEIRFEAG
jgi:alpha-L-rhamnosidase